jgi:hypothetical protein
MVLFCGASTYALGRIFIQHFNSGGTFLTFDAEKVQEHFRQLYAEGTKLAAEMESSKPEEAPAPKTKSRA